jgi:hypothetical protein
MPDTDGEWILSGEVVGYYSTSQRLLYGSYSWRRAGDRPYKNPEGTPFLMCDGQNRFFGVVYEPARGRILRLDYNQGGVVPSAPWTRPPSR